MSRFLEFWKTLQADQDLRYVVRCVSITVRWIDRRMCEAVLRV